MNIIELARKAGLRSAVLLDMYKTKDALTPSEELELEQYQTFANDVIAARDAELIAGVGEPVAKFNWYTGKFEWLTEYSYQLHHDKPLYTAAQVAGAVAAKDALIKEMQQNNLDWMKRSVGQEKRIATLESTLKVALEVLAINQYAVADQAPHKDVMNYNATIEKIEGVLHATDK